MARPRSLRRTTGAAVLAWTILAGGSCAPAHESAPDARDPERPAGLILISLDTMRADRLSGYGRIERTTTPVLDRLAGEAVVFDDCLAASTVTGPSHLSLFTGQYPRRHGLVKNGGRVEARYTLASVLRDAGWETAGFTGGGYLREIFGLGFGFQTYRARGGPLARFKRTLATSIPHALEWLESRDGSRPFFLFLHGYDPHCPYEASPAALRRLGASEVAPFDPAGKCGEEDYLPLLRSGAFDDDDLEHLTDLYDALVLSADESLKPLVYQLRKTGLLDHVILVFTSDHGEGLGEHGWIGHGRLWDEQARVPLFIRFPGGAWAGSRDEPVSLVDLLPTLLDALGLPLPDGVQGRSLMPIVRGETGPSDRLRVVTFDDEETVRYGARWKIAFRWEDGEAVERHLYDLAADPGEERDLADTPGGRARFEAVFERYRGWRAAGADDDRKLRILAGEPELDAAGAAELSGLGYATGGD